jgi:hypothetical protein
MIYQPAFHRVLGIPEGTVEPTPYDLLGMPPEPFTAEQVAARLRQRQRWIRLNLPGLPYVPLVLLWDAQLARAADTLSTAKDRRAFHRQVVREAADPDLTAHRTQREERIRRIHTCLDSLCEAGVLADKDRPEAARRLRQFGLDQTEIDAVLQHTPKLASRRDTPTAIAFFDSVLGLSLADGRLTEPDEQLVRGLAKRLGVPTGTVGRTIYERSLAADIERGNAPPRLIARPEAAASEPLDAEELEALAILSAREPRRRRHLPIAVGAACIVVFLGLGLMLALHWGGGGEEGAPVDGPALREGMPPKRARAKAGPRQALEPPLGHRKQAKREPASPHTTPKQGHAALAPRVMRTFTRDSDPEMLLTDVALALAACEDVVARFVYEEARPARAIDRAIKETDWKARAARLTRLARVSPMPKVGLTPSTPEDRGERDEDEALGPDRLHELSQSLRSAVPGIQFRAMADLEQANSGAAAKVILDGVEAVVMGKGGPFRTVRALRVLSRMRDPGIAARLAQLLSRCRSAPIAYYIARALCEDARQRAGVATLGFDSNLDQRRECAQHWERAIDRGQVVWGRSKRERRAPGPVDRRVRQGGPAWAPSPLPLRLTVQCVRSMECVARLIAAHRWHRQPVAPRQSPRLTLSAVETEARLVRALQASFEALDSMVRAYPTDRPPTCRAEAIRLKMTASLALSDTNWQKAVVLVNGACVLLDLLGRTREPALGPRLNAIRQERVAVLAGAANVLEELRAGAYYQLTLWEIVAGVGATNPPG